jgi:uncharacterized membrane protein YeaQ/YmgE (transglycosylase-associated protein family)
VELIMIVSFVVFVLFGFVVGAIAKYLVGGPAGFWETAGLGMAGALVGELIAYGAGWVRRPWTLAVFFVAVFGAVAVILAARAIRRDWAT